MSAQHIVMNFAMPPSIEDLRVIAEEVVQTLPDELLGYTEKLALEIEDFPDEAAQQEQDVSDPFELLVLLKRSSELYPGVERKIAKSDSLLTVFRRPVLDYWCESCDDLFTILRHVVIEEIGRVYDLLDEDIAELLDTHHQRLL